MEAVEPLCVRVHQRDNVAIIANPEGLPAGTSFPCGLRLTEAIPQAHKTALCDLAQGAAIVRYGEVIGYAERPIARGSWVREEMVSMPPAPALDELPLATAVPAHPGGDPAAIPRSGRRGGDHAHLRVRGGHRRAGRRDSHPHLAQYQPASKPGRGAAGRESGMREIAAFAHVGLGGAPPAGCRSLAG